MSNVASFLYNSPLLQLVNGQCILNIKMHQFENMYNVEIRPEQEPSQVCCCDQPHDTCQSDLSAFSGAEHECASYESCDTYFVANLSECQISDPCPTILNSNVFNNNSTGTDVNYTFRFNLSTVPRESV